MDSLGSFNHNGHKYDVLRLVTDPVWFVVNEDGDLYMKFPMSFLRYCDISDLDDPKDQKFFNWIKDEIINHNS